MPDKSNSSGILMVFASANIHHYGSSGTYLPVKE